MSLLLLSIPVEQIPPAPPRPDFDASREKLQKLGEGEGTMTKEEFDKMKQELEAEYLATFKKTVAMHEVFLQRLASHPKFRVDANFKIFLEYDHDVCCITLTSGVLLNDVQHVYLTYSYQSGARVKKKSCLVSWRILVNLQMIWF